MASQCTFYSKATFSSHYFPNHNLNQNMPISCPFNTHLELSRFTLIIALLRIPPYSVRRFITCIVPEIHFQAVGEARRGSEVKLPDIFNKVILWMGF